VITFSKLNEKGINLGNQLHRLASLIGFSEKYQCELVIPDWKYAPYFMQVPKQGLAETELNVKEENFHYTPEFWDQYKEEFQTKNVDIWGYFQSEKYWIHCKLKVLQALSFKVSFIQEVKTKFSSAFSKPTIAMSIRRGDFATTPGYFLLPLEFYLQALVEFFPDHEKYNMIIFSDDLHYCKAHIRNLKNIFFAIGLKDIEQLCLMSLCDHFIISNSTFSWWGARLGEKEGTKIIRSPYQYRGWLSHMNTKDYYPERWFVYDHVNRACDVEDLLYPKRISQLRMLFFDSKKLKHSFRRITIKLRNKQKIFLLQVKSRFAAVK